VQTTDAPSLLWCDSCSVSSAKQRYVTSLFAATPAVVRTCPALQSSFEIHCTASLQHQQSSTQLTLDPQVYTRTPAAHNFPSRPYTFHLSSHSAPAQLQHSPQVATHPHHLPDISAHASQQVLTSEAASAHTSFPQKRSCTPIRTHGQVAVAPPAPKASASTAEAHAFTDVYVSGHGTQVATAVPQFGGSTTNSGMGSHVWGVKE
jgi:hypothetical protein